MKLHMKRRWITARSDCFWLKCSLYLMVGYARELCFLASALDGAMSKFAENIDMVWWPDQPYNQFPF